VIRTVCLWIGAGLASILCSSIPARAAETSHAEEVEPARRIINQVREELANLVVAPVAPYVNLWVNPEVDDKRDWHVLHLKFREDARIRLRDGKVAATAGGVHQSQVALSIQKINAIIAESDNHVNRGMSG
jgi:hypothetical protein